MKTSIFFLIIFSSHLQVLNFHLFADAASVPGMGQQEAGSEDSGTGSRVSRQISWGKPCGDVSATAGVCVSGGSCGTSNSATLTQNRIPGYDSDCSNGDVCCSNSVQGNPTITKNNTKWVNTGNNPVPGTYTASLEYDSATPICQIRIYNSFNLIAGPNDQSVCVTDTLTATGQQNDVPTLCGDLTKQHFHLEVPPTTTTSSVNLIFTIASNDESFGWNVYIQYLPCTSTLILAPEGCLQYYYAGNGIGIIRSFNWKDKSSTVTLQLANMNYRICIRTELSAGAGSTRNTKICYATCGSSEFVTNTQNTFSLSQANNRPRLGTAASAPLAALSQHGPRNCNSDSLIIPAGFDPNVTPVTSNTNYRSEYCGQVFNTLLLQKTSSTVCSTAQPFQMHYRTNNDEIATITSDSAGKGNLGFCLKYTQSTS